MSNILLIYKYIIRNISTFLFSLRVTDKGDRMRVNKISYISSSPKVYLGNNCNFNGIRIYGKGILKIGNNFHSGENILIMLGGHDYDSGDSIPYGRGTTNKNITIGNNVWVGTNVTIIGDIIIGDGAIIGVGSVVVKDVPENAIVGGNPANIIKYRDKEHYNTLLSQNKFI